MHCRQEHHDHGGHDSHGHGHGHGGHAHSHGDECDHKKGPDDPAGNSLWSSIDMTKTYALNERFSNSVNNCLKQHVDRCDRTKFVQSHKDDTELIVHVPFSTGVHIKSIRISGPNNRNHPREVRIFANRSNIDFDLAEDLKPVQKFDLAIDPEARLTYAVKASKFRNVHNITLHFPDMESIMDSPNTIYYIGFYGVSTKMKPIRAVEAVYESRPMPKDHDVKEDAAGASYLK